jgi:hypothetical protein
VRKRLRPCVLLFQVIRGLTDEIPDPTESETIGSCGGRRPIMSVESSMGRSFDASRIARTPLPRVDRF